MFGVSPRAFQFGSAHVLRFGFNVWLRACVACRLQPHVLGFGFHVCFAVCVAFKLHPRCGLSGLTFGSVHVFVKVATARAALRV